MEKSKRSIFFNINLALLFFFALGGYYVLLILVSNLGSNSMSRMFTIPIRILIILSLFFLYKNTDCIRSLDRSGKFFVFFSILYIIRICIESFKISIFYMSETSFLLYFLSFVLIPFWLFCKIKFSELDYKKIFYSILVGCIGVSVLTYFYYGQLIGNIGRISQEIGKDENYISPLALSYCAVLGISVGLSYLLTNKVSKTSLFLIISVILACFIPFFLGASRGGIVAIIIPFLLYFLFSRGLKGKIRFLFLGIVISFLTVSSTDIFGTAVFDRFTSISNDIDQGSSSAVRLEMWKDGLNQFLNNPVFGNSLQLDSVRHYPHNVFIEVLLSTGLIGFIPFAIFIYMIFKKSVFIIRYRPDYFWLTSVFLVGFTQNMFSGALWNMSWLAIGASLIIGLKNQKT